MKKNLFIALISVALVGPAACQSPKGAEQNRTKKTEKPTSNVNSEFSIFRSHINSVGTIGKTGRYQIVSARLRGWDSPNISALLAYDSETDSLAVLASGVEPGLGVAIVNGGASVGGNYLFGSKLRPDRTSVNNNSQSEGSSADGGNSVSVSEGGDASSVSKSAGGNASSVSVSDADAKSSVTSSANNSNANVNSNSSRNNVHQVSPPASTPKPKKSGKSKKSKKSRKH